MKKTFIICTALLLITAWSTQARAYEAITGPTGVLYYDKDKAFNGYTLFSPMINCKTTYLIDMEGNVVHSWESQYRPGLHAVMLPNGNMLRGGVVEQEEGKTYCQIGGVGGIIEEFDWDGNVVWSYKLFEPGKSIQHHTFCRMPNGNTLILAWEAKTKKEAISKGRDPKTVPDKPVKYRGTDHNDFWVDFVREVDKNGKAVWEWHVWDHIGTGPDEFDINYHLPQHVGHGILYPDLDWTHFNTVFYIPSTDTVVLNSRNFSEFYFINHKTGKMEYRWGNPSTHNKGKRPGWYDNADQKVFGSHCATPLENGNILIFDNGSERPEGNRSAAVEVNPETGEIVWEYVTKQTNSFFSYRQGAVQRLSNGNTFITSTHGGHFIEVTKDKEVVWEYISPVFSGKFKCVAEDSDALPLKSNLNGMANMIHRAYRYGADFPGLKGKDLSAKKQMGNCPQFYKDYKEGATLSGTTAAEDADENEEEDGPTMKSY